MRITITCEECGRRHRLERSITEPGAIWIICHDCELPLRAVLNEQQSKQQPSQQPVAIGDSFRIAWGDTLDLSSPAGDLLTADGQ